MSTADAADSVAVGPQRDSGAAAVEFAIILPFLLLLVGGVVDFGRLFYAEIMVTNAAREGVRMVALGFPDDAAERANAASPGLDLFGGLATEAAVPCLDGNDVASFTVRAADFRWLLLDAFAPISAPQPTSTATMRCWG